MHASDRRKHCRLPHWTSSFSRLDVDMCMVKSGGSRLGAVYTQEIPRPSRAPLVILVKWRKPALSLAKCNPSPSVIMCSRTVAALQRF